MWTVSPDDRRRDMSSKAAVVFPVPVSPFTRRSRVFRSSNFCNSGGKGISGDAPRSSFNIRPPNWREEETWAAIYHGCVLRCVLLCSPKVNWVARSIRWRTERKKSSDDAAFSEARRRGTRRVGPSAPRRTDSDLPCCFTSNVAKGGPRACTLCVRCHRSARGALQGTRDGTRVRMHRSPSAANIIPQSAIGGSPGTPYHPAIKKRNVYLCVHDGHIPSNPSPSR